MHSRICKEFTELDCKVHTHRKRGFMAMDEAQKEVSGDT